MSMPELPNPSKIPTLDEAIAAIIASIAMEEVALSRVIDAESEKIKFIVECAKSQGCENMNIEDILAINKSVADVLEEITRLQIILKEKLDIATSHIPDTPVPPVPPVPPKPPKPPIPPKPPFPPFPPCTEGYSICDNYK